jgi:GSH-dependent disulfide-bond oxidoreductase
MVKGSSKAAPRKLPKSRKIAAKPPAKRARRQRPIELYFWPTSNGLKISIMLEECGLPYDIKPVNINRGEQFAPHFLSISPNNRIPAIVDPDGPGGKPIGIFESGAILQYLGRKTGKFYPRNERDLVETDQWLFWQMGGLGPMAGQAHHFRGDAPQRISYAIDRYTNEVNRLYGVMEARLADRDYLARRYSIADIACWGWSRNWKRQGQDIEQFPRVKAWHARIAGRPAVQRGAKAGEYLRDPNYRIGTDPIASKILFGQRARK